MVYNINIYEEIKFVCCIQTSRLFEFRRIGNPRVSCMPTFPQFPILNFACKRLTVFETEISCDLVCNVSTDIILYNVCLYAVVRTRMIIIITNIDH